MVKREINIAVIGGGAAGLAAAIKAKEKGIENIMVLERNEELGGILPQCIHTGFGLRYSKENLTVSRLYWDRVLALNLNMCLDLAPGAMR